jgi:hypothetical protein
MKLKTEMKQEVVVSPHSQDPVSIHDEKSELRRWEEDTMTKESA